MPRLRLSFQECRRRALCMRVRALEKLESKSTITEPISFTGLSLSAVRGLVQLGIVPTNGGANGQLGGAVTGRLMSISATRAKPLDPAELRSPGPGSERLGIAVVPEHGGQGSGGALPDVPRVAGLKAVQPSGSEDGTQFIRSLGATAHAEAPSGLSTPWHPATRPGGGATLPPRGGSGNGAEAATVAAVQGRVPHPQPLSAPTAPPAIPGVLTGGGPPPSSAPSLPGAVISRNAAAQRLNPAVGPVANGSTRGPAGDNLAASTVGSSSGSAMVPENPWSLPYSGPKSPIKGPLNAPLIQFPYFPLYTLNWIQGDVLWPNGYQLATLDGNVDLRAQVKNATGVTFSWNTTNLAKATNIATSGTGNEDLTFTWTSFNPSAVVDSVTLTATSGTEQESQTYYFQVPAGSSSTNTGSASWPATLSPDTVLPGAASWSSAGVSVDANSGALDTSIALPGYNPNIPGIALDYDSLTADPRPIILVPHPLDPTQVVPTAVNATLTFNSQVGTTWYYNTSQFIPGDVQEIALQANATGLSTGRYNYSVQVVDERLTNTTFTYSGTATVLNQSTSAFGDGWTLQGLEQIIPASGGVILTLGDGGESLWFSGSPSVGQNYTSPAGDFSTLTLTSSGWTRVLPNGTQITFNSSGSQTATIDLNGLHTTYSYSSGLLSTIEDPYGNLTTFTYSSGKLASIEDPADRLTTFTFSGNDLTSVQQADSTRVTFTYDSAGRITEREDPLGHVTSIVYDPAERVGTITQPDGTTQLFASD
ncbi:MAG TPA: hypothetical protein VFF52_26545, partial [Isosphaeraceae bacterium]|nr:hypothetical protein [Isosphaeraceae bacterium]